MPVIGVTGGIASGKSTVTQMIFHHVQSFAKVERFSADDYSHQLLANDPAVKNAVVALWGLEICNSDGSVSRPALRQKVFGNTEARNALERILHPKIHQYWQTRAKLFRGSPNYFIAEIPLLYETNGAQHFDCIVVVAADAAIQLQRLSSKRGWSLETARRVIEAQMPAAEKMRLADILILNHHTEKLLQRQAHLAVSALLMRYA